MGIAGFIIWSLVVGFVIGTVMFLGYLIEHFDVNAKLDRFNKKVDEFDDRTWVKGQAARVRREARKS